MKDNELMQVLKSLTQLLDDPRFGPDQKIMFRKAKRNFQEMAQAGKFDRAKIYRAADMICKAVLEADEPPND
jgi:hypothetical protein